MSGLSLDFQQAKIKHLQFKSNLRSILYGVTNVDEKPVLSHYECSVGKWIYDHALSHYGHIPEMNELEKVHADIHTKARQLILLYKEGKVAMAKAGLTDIENIAEKLVGLLEIVENEITKSKKQDTAEYQSIEMTKAELDKLTKTNEKLDKLIKRQSLELSHERQHLKDLFMEFPAMITIIKGEDQIIEMSNDTAKKFIGKEDIEGKSVKDVLPELESQGFLDLIDQVYKNGITVCQKEVPVKLFKGENVINTYIDFSFIPMKNADGGIDGVISFSYDVTSLVESRKRIEESAISLKHANEDLEVKVKFRNKQLEIENRELLKRLEKYESSKGHDFLIH